MDLHIPNLFGENDMIKHSLQFYILRLLEDDTANSFEVIQEQTKSTAGNLGKALNILIKDKLIKVTEPKGIVRHRLYSITKKGKQVINEYIIEAMRGKDIFGG